MLFRSAIEQTGKGLPLARSRCSWLIVGTHSGIERQLGAARHRSTLQPSTARAGTARTQSRVSKPIHASGRAQRLGIPGAAAALSSARERMMCMMRTFKRSAKGGPDAMATRNAT